MLFKFNSAVCRVGRRAASCLLIAALAVFPIAQETYALADPSAFSKLYLPAPSQPLSLTPAFEPTMIEGLTIDPKDPLRFDFIVAPGQKAVQNAEVQKIIDYFFASLTIPKEDLWVNLSPYEKHRIIPPNLAATEMGRDLLAQDYLLKQLTASLMDPRTPLGKKFWHEVYRKTYERFGTTNIAVNTFNKVWIMPSRAAIWQQGPSAFVADSHLKVLLEEDYLALSRHIYRQGTGPNLDSPVAAKAPDASHLVSGIVKQMVLPEIEREVNSGRYFAPLRQIYNAMILAKWYKQAFAGGPLAKAYDDQNKIKGIDLKDRTIKATIYGYYLRAYRKGLYNFIQEDYDAAARETVPKKYFAGGIALDQTPELKTNSMADSAMVSRLRAHAITYAVMVKTLLRTAFGSKEPSSHRIINGDDDNLVWLKRLLFGHAIISKAYRGSQSLYLSKPSGDAVLSVQILGAVSNTLERFYDPPQKPLFFKNNPIKPKNGGFRGIGLLWTIQPDSLGRVVLSNFLIGSGRSIRDWDRRLGNGDPMAMQDIIAFTDNGRDLKVKNWEIIHGGRKGTILQALAQPRNTAEPHDEHFYALRIVVPPGVKVTTNNNLDLELTASSDQKIPLKVELYSDHKTLEHLTFEQLYTPETLRQLSELQGPEKERFLRMLLLGKYLITRNAPMLAGSPYYATVFPPDVFIVLRELIGFLNPEVLRDQFYMLLKLERDGQFAHEIDIRQSSHVESYQQDRHRMIRSDVELLALMYAQAMLRHKEIGINWNEKIHEGETVKDVIRKVAQYVLKQAQKLQNDEDFAHLLTSKREGDPRASWRDGAPSTFHGTYINLLRDSMVLALQAIQEIDTYYTEETNAEEHIIPADVDVGRLITTWEGAQKLFTFEQTRQERIDGLIHWYRWKITRDKEGANLVQTLLEDAQEYYGIDYPLDFDANDLDKTLGSIRAFLETYMPNYTSDKPYIGQAIALDGNGKPIKIDDTDPIMFHTAFLLHVPIGEIKQGLKSEFLHLAFGGTATTSGQVLTGLPVLAEEDRYISKPVPPDAERDIYKMYKGNYHGMVQWIAMEYKKLNGLVKQINALLDKHGRLTPEIKTLILAVKVRFDELARLRDQESQETLEPFAVLMPNGKFALEWRPLGNGEAVSEDAEEPVGIHSGALQGFNLMILPALSNWENLVKRIESLEGGGEFMAYLQKLSPVEGRRLVRKGLGEPLRHEDYGHPAVDQAMHTQHSTPGGIDLNSDLYTIHMLNPKADQPQYSPFNSLDPIEGIVPVIISRKPFQIKLKAPPRLKREGAFAQGF